MTKNEHAVALGRVGGQSRSPAKRAASAANGKKRKVTNFTLRHGQDIVIYLDGEWRDAKVTVFSRIEVKLVGNGFAVLIQAQPETGV